MAPMAPIPRFLLPRRGPLWQQPGQVLVRLPASRPLRPSTCRHASSSSSAPSRPPPGNILEKPAKFNPPSHGSRLPRKGPARHVPPSQHYGGDLSAAELEARRSRQYPGMMAPKGTWTYWFWNSRVLHMSITMTALVALALFTFFENFRRTSPYVDMLPTSSEALHHPILAVRRTIEVMRLTEQQRVAEITAKRQRRVDDVAKRTMYRKAHGLEETVGFSSGWLSGGVAKKTEDGPLPPARNEEAYVSPAAAAAAPASVDDASPVRSDRR